MNQAPHYGAERWWCEAYHAQRPEPEPEDRDLTAPGLQISGQEEAEVQDEEEDEVPEVQDMLGAHGFGLLRIA